ncbi:hypothetical protein J7T55_006632 [Diaporthe amygdali]|uniref:uncharacterized protein n=1 Tax=Phomopsis amygdali TaxID=1214568 RepID=UPI0022FE780E|nr:uncharacterized protein J7T55_006632 [Diaporthe amygdali]KAJ0125287.1 hypothetical protein J7T55_006632 [Diaporthe amygdali]
MKNTLRSLFGRKPKNQATNKNLESNQTPAVVTKPESGPRQFVAPDPFESEAQFQAVKDHVQSLAATNPEHFAMISRAASFRTAEFWMMQNFSDAQVVNSGCFPGDISTLGENVRPEDTQFFVAIDPGNPRKFIAVNLVVFNSAFMMPGSGDALETSEMKAAEEGLLKMLREWHKDGMSDGFLVILSMGMDLEIWNFSGKDGLVDIPEGIDIVAKKVTED